MPGITAVPHPNVVTEFVELVPSITVFRYIYNARIWIDEHIFKGRLLCTDTFFCEYYNAITRGATL